MQKFDVKYQTVVILLMREYSMGIFEYCYNHKCDQSISVLHKDLDYNIIDRIYHNTRTNIKYKPRIDRWFCNQCVDNEIAIDCSCECEDCC